MIVGDDYGLEKNEKGINPMKTSTNDKKNKNKIEDSVDIEQNVFSYTC